MSKYPHLSSSLKLDTLILKNRVFLAALTRDRNVAGLCEPDALNVEYYRQRSTAGLIFSEGILISPQGTEWTHAPGLWSPRQVSAWKKVTDAVHEEGSVMFAQLWHVGRVAHPVLQCGIPSPGPSAIAAKGGSFRRLEGAPGYVPPEAIADPWEYIELYRKAAKNARSAGFDGVELHAANGYLPNQFLEAHSNQRTDDFGGSAQKRAKFIIEATKALIDGFGGSPQRVGIKLSPCGGYNDMGDSVEVATEEYSIVIQELEKLGVGYFQFSRYNPYMDPTSRGTPMDVIKVFGPMVKKAHVLVNNSVQPGEAEEMLEKGLVAGAVIGRDFLANPDLPSRWALGKELNPIDYATLYGAQSSETRSKGYTDYPTAK